MFEWRANGRWLEAGGAAPFFDSATLRCVRNVLAVPDEEEVHPVNSCHCNMKGIDACLRGQAAPGDQIAGK